MNIQERIAITLFVTVTVAFFIWVLRLWLKK